ncbi:TRIC cation channel family protein [Streptomyces sp. NPDC005774]|uniref:TRIC cation channel family protein n=1 Tax=Streptomyces sp. NPDC005774 TaxID=3364728 RepID=UPI0036C54EA2
MPASPIPFREGCRGALPGPRHVFLCVPLGAASRAAGLDLFGFLVLGITSGPSGSTIRDVLRQAHQSRCHCRCDGRRSHGGLLVRRAGGGVGLGIVPRPGFRAYRRALRLESSQWLHRQSRSNAASAVRRRIDPAARNGEEEQPRPRKEPR